MNKILYSIDLFIGPLSIQTKLTYSRRICKLNTLKLIIKCFIHPFDQSRFALSTGETVIFKGLMIEAIPTAAGRYHLVSEM